MTMKCRCVDFLKELAKLWAVFATLALVVIPTEVILRGPTICLFRRFFDMKCLGCGMIRAMSLFAHGQTTLATSYNRFVWCAFPALIGLALCQLWQRAQRARCPQ